VANDGGVRVTYRYSGTPCAHARSLDTHTHARARTHTRTHTHTHTHTHTLAASVFKSCRPSRAQVTWHGVNPAAPFHALLRTPLVAEVPTGGVACWPAEGVVPWPIFSMKIELPGTSGWLALLARHWGILGPLGLPSPLPYERLPAVLTQASVASAE
jgi:hypothetical protein